MTSMASERDKARRPKRWRPRFSVRTLVVICLLVGAVAIPVGYQKRKADEIERLEQELAQRCNELQLYLAQHSGGSSLPGAPPPTIATPPPRLLEPIERIEDRLEKLTGVPSERLRLLLQSHADTDYL